MVAGCVLDSWISTTLAPEVNPSEYENESIIFDKIVYKDDRSNCKLHVLAPS